MTDNRTLIVVLAGQRVGIVDMEQSGRFTFTYDDHWRKRPAATPLSLSLPLARRDHGDRPVRAFLWGLLPDNERVLERWAREYGVPAGNPFALLRHVGEDCAGAAQFVTPDRLDALLAGAGGVTWMTEADVADRLRVLRHDPAAWHVHSTGQFSLAGAQAKTALLFDRPTRRWGEPWGATPTTHILKPAVAGLDDHDLNEHLCLRAADQLGLIAAKSTVESFGAERAIVVERYDRLPEPDGTVTRVHQEDTCQSLGIPPSTKYQNEGGPSPEQIITLIRHAVADQAAASTVGRFVDALALNWIIGGTDAHAKNYSMLLAGSQVRLAPLYDVASALAYDDFALRRLTLAMKIGGYYQVRTIEGRHWRRFAGANRVDADALLARIDDLADRIPAAFATAAADPAVEAIGSRLPGRLVDRVTVRATECRAALLR